MIERLTTTLRELGALGAAQLSSDASAKLRGDCADAVRLELDCPQQALTPAQRAALARLSDALDGAADVEQLLEAIRAANRAIVG